MPYALHKPQVWPVVGLLFLMCLPFLRAETMANPQEGDILVPLPEGQHLTFRVVPLSIGDGLFASKEFFVGGRGEEGFKEAPMRVSISGSVVLERADKADWCLLFGKHEVTRAQWAAVLGEAMPEPQSADLPMVGISRAQILTFIERANAWLKDGSSISIPGLKRKSGRLFLRLPDESEWEFVARAGIPIDNGRFDRRNPYEGPLNQYEWFDGPDSSNGRLRPAGRLAPNALGIHDMLGNAAEFVEGIYRIEYLQGRNGGLIVRGGHFLTPESQIHASQRMEVPICQENGSPFHSDTIGFRLVLGSSLMPTVGAARELEAEWENYSAHRVIAQPALPPTASLAQQTSAETAEISTLLDGIAGALKINPDKGGTIESKMNLLRPQIVSMQARIDQASKYFAEGGVTLASVAGALAMDTIERKLSYEKLHNPSAELVMTIKAAQKKADHTIHDSREKLKEACVMLAQIDVQLVTQAFDSKFDDLHRKAEAEGEPSYARQAECTRLTKDLALEYIRSRKLNLDDWESKVMELVKKAMKKTE